MYKFILLLILLVQLQAKLFVSKAPDCGQLIVGAECPIYYHFSNIGSKTLVNVRMNDDWALEIRALAKIIKGSPAATFPKLRPNEHFFHSFILKLEKFENGAKLAELISKPAAVEYTSDGKNYTVYSSSITGSPAFRSFNHIIDSNVYAKSVKPKLHYWTVFATLVGVPTLYSLIYHWKIDRDYPMKSHA